VRDAIELSAEASVFSLTGAAQALSDSDKANAKLASLGRFREASFFLNPGDGFLDALS
jgi:hypothetical protein